MTPRFYVFWAINAALDQKRLRRQLDQFHAAGFDGVVWHPRFYTDEPPYLGERYLAEVSDVILHAKALGLTFWIYDENGWPSGTVGGLLLKKFPDNAQRWAELVTERPERCLTEFKHAGKKWFLAERTGAGVDYFNPNLAWHFLQLTHERYRTGLKPEAWQHVEAFFCDEPEFGLGHAYASLSIHGAIPWTPHLPELFRQRHGENLLPLIPKIFFAGDGCAETRVKFWELLTDIFNESFTAPINGWCARHGKKFTAHLKGEEHPLFQVPTSGSCHQFFRHLSLPGIDALERYPANNFFPRQVSSAARQFGDGRCMAEAFGGAGWGATPEDLERYLLWLGRNGLTDFVMHLSQYRLDSAALHDWPPSQPLHLTWREAYPDVVKRVRRELEKHPRPPADAIVIAPNRGIMASYAPQEFLQTNVHNAAAYPDSVAGKINCQFLDLVEELHCAGVNYDIVDERTLEQFGKANGDGFTIGKCAYSRVIMPDGCGLNSATRALIQPLVAGTPGSGLARVRFELTKCAALVVGAPIALQWSLEKHPLNSLLLECAVEAGNWFAAKFSTGAALGEAKLELLFADDIDAVELNGRNLAIRQTDDGTVVAVDATLIQSVNRLRFRAVSPKVQRPFVWLRGLFRVVSTAPFVSGPNNTIKTDGPFSLRPAHEQIRSDLTVDGFPFLRESIVVSANVTLLTANSLTLVGAEADAARLWIDGDDCGWTWRTAGGFCFTAKFTSGAHTLRLELVPNTFNAFGPHHYFAGDWHVVGPDQVRGVKNFADAPNAPTNTHGAAWHFRRLRLPEKVLMRRNEEAALQ